MVGVFERVYEVGPVFRAEEHNTSRHLAEYVSLDVEFGFIENHFTVMALLEDVLRGMFTTLEEDYSAEWPSPTPNYHAFHNPFRIFILRTHSSLIYELHGEDVRAANPIYRRKMNDGWARGRWPNTAATSCSSPVIQWSNDPFTHILTRQIPCSQTRLTYYFAGLNW